MPRIISRTISIVGYKYERRFQRLVNDLINYINSIKDKENRLEQIDMARIFAGLRFNAKLIDELLLGGDMLEESVIVQDLLKRGRKEGLKEGLEKGREKGREEGLLAGERLVVRRLISHRFGRLSVKTKEQIGRLSRKQIEKLSATLFDLKEKSELFAWLEKHSR